MPFFSRRSARGAKTFSAGRGLQPWAFLVACLIALALAPPGAGAAPSHFDLAGPQLSITVTRGAQTLPISEAPDLAPDDRLRVRAIFPAAQSARYLLIVAFLRGATDPPPKAWFHQSEAWLPQARGGLTISAPEGATNALIFLAPATRSGFGTLVDSVRHNPGLFVRAAQELERLDLDRTRMDAFLTAIQRAGQADPLSLKTRSATLARSLVVNVDRKCFVEPPELQAPCLTKDPAALVMEDSAASALPAFRGGSSGGVIQQLLGAGASGAGYYGSYVGDVIGVARVVNALNTAAYQYIPAMTKARGDQASLFLNTPPSFGEPKSVLVAALPPFEPATPPALRPPPATGAFCADQPALLLPAEGAPLAFSTAYAHDLALRLTDGRGASVDLPARLDAARGGFVVETAGLRAGGLQGPLAGTIHGYWGFAPFAGPHYALQTEAAQSARLEGDGPAQLTVGGDVTVHLATPDAACVRHVSVALASAPAPAVWSLVGPDELAVTLPLRHARPGVLAISVVKDDGARDVIRATAFAPPSDLDRFALRAGDTAGVLYGRRLDEVAALRLGGVEFEPQQLTTGATGDQLTMTAANAQAALGLGPGASDARVALKDGRLLQLAVSVEPPRPSVALVGQVVRPVTSPTLRRIELVDPGDLPAGATLSFSLRALRPAAFSGAETIEVATSPGDAQTLLTFRNGLALIDPQMIRATLDTRAAFPSSAFGALRFRIIEDGVAGDWQPLGDLVRLPERLGLVCPASPGQPCRLTGADLVRIASISAEPGFQHAVQVPDAFYGGTLAAPHPAAGQLYVRLRDDPSVTDLLNFPPAGPPSLFPTGPSSPVTAVAGSANVHSAPGAS